MKIGNFDTDKEVLVIAEIGNNHEGSYALAEEMIGLAVEAGAGAVKLQTFRTEHYVGLENKDRFNMLKSFELTYNDFERLKKVADDAGVLFISTPFDIQSGMFLNNIVPAFKIASGDNTFYPLLETVAGFGKPIILSCGLTSLVRLRYAKALIERVWSEKNFDQKMAVLHCVTSYPVPLSQANLGAIQLLKKELQCQVGYSDHTVGVESAVFAVATGARIVEKHFTLDKKHSDFRDHQLSADPSDLKLMIDQIRVVEEMMGSGEKVLQECEKSCITAVRRSIVANKDIRKGAVVRLDDITWVRPAGGIPPGREGLVLGKTVTRDVCRGELLTFDILE